MAINFPSSPTLNDTHTHSGKEWTWNGTSWILSTNASSYTLPIATSGALGGIKVGSRLTINSATGVLDADVQSGSSYDDSDVDTHLNQSNPTSGYVLSWNGSDYAWVAQTAAESDTLDTVTGRGATTSNNITVGDFICSNLTVNGTTTTVNSNTVNIGDNILTLNSDEAGTPSQNAGLEIERGTSTNVSLRWNEGNDKWEFTNDGTNYSNIASSSDTYTDADVDTHLNRSSPTSGYVLSWNGTDYAWVAQTAGTFTGLTGTPSSYTAGKWLKVNAGGTALEYTDAPNSQVVTDDSAPGSPSDGDLWWDSDSGRLNIYYQDTDSAQWVDASPLGAPNIQGNMTGHIIPTSNASYDLGNATYKIRHLFLSDNSLKFGDAEKSLGVSGSGQLQFDGKDLLQNVVFSGLDNNETIKYNGTNWVNEAWPAAFDGTLSGDLTVDTNVLKVDTANNQVGIGTASPNSLLHLYQATDAVYITFGQGQHNTNYWVGTTGTTAGFFIEQGSSNNMLLEADASDYVSLWGAGTKRIETTASGVTITGDLSVTGSGLYNDAAVNTHINTATATSNQLLSWTGSDYDWIDAPTPAPPAFQSNWRIPL